MSLLLDVVDELTQAEPFQYCPEVQELLPEVEELTQAEPFQYCPDAHEALPVVVVGIWQ